MTAHLSINFFKAFDFYRFRKRCARVGLKLRKTSASTSSTPLSWKMVTFRMLSRRCVRVGLELRKTSASTKTMVGAVLSTPT
jgi:hypothetical protein